MLCCDWTDVILACMITMTTRLLDGTVDATIHQAIYPETDEKVCCSGVLGYASDNMSLTYPCQYQQCCNSSHVITVTAIDFALGFRFQCMPRKNVQTLCYQTGAEVRSTNQDPDFIPRACCQGLKFKILLNLWHAAMMVKCVEEMGDTDS